MTSFDGDKKIETKYTAEFVTDKKDYAYIIGGRYNDGEPWEKYQKKEFDDLDKALEFYMRGLVDDSLQRKFVSTGKQAENLAGRYNRRMKHAKLYTNGNQVDDRSASRKSAGVS